MTTVERFEAMFQPEPNSGCWLWTGALGRGGYGQFWLDGQMRIAHRVAWILNYGPIPDGLHVCHRCDVRSCVNHSHLFLGTNAENVIDKCAKGRHRVPIGEKQWHAILTEDAVRMIRLLRSGYSPPMVKELAARFGVSSSAIKAVLCGRNWKHVQGGKQQAA